MAVSPLHLVEKDTMDKEKALEAALGQIERSFGKGSIMKLGQREQAVDIEAVSTGSLGLDIALGIGGLPRGRVVEIYGPESSGKTTLALHVIAEAQKTGGTCAFVDAEHALDPGYAKKLGVDIDDLLISQPDAGEQALEIADTLVRSGAVDVLVIDSVAALVPRAELEGEMGDSHVGLHARLMSQALRKLTGSINRSRCMVIFINQIRMKIGVMFGSPETTTGGNAPSSTPASVWIFVALVPSRIATMVGNQTRVKVVKNKMAPPFKMVEFDIMYGEGISRPANCLTLVLRVGSLRNRAPGFPTTVSASAKAGRMRRSSLRKILRSLTPSNVACARMRASFPNRCSKAVQMKVMVRTFRRSRRSRSGLIIAFLGKADGALAAPFCCIGLRASFSGHR